VCSKRHLQSSRERKKERERRTGLYLLEKRREIVYDDGAQSSSTFSKPKKKKKKGVKLDVIQETVLSKRDIGGGGGVRADQHEITIFKSAKGGGA